MRFARRALATLLSFLLVALCPGLEAWAAAAGTSRGRSASARSTPEVALVYHRFEALGPVVLPDLKIENSAAASKAAATLSGHDASAVLRPQKNAVAVPARETPAVAGEISQARDESRSFGLAADRASTLFQRLQKAVYGAFGGRESREDGVLGGAVWDGAAGASEPSQPSLGSALAAGAAFGYGDTHTVEAHAQVNARLKRAGADGRLAAARGEGLPAASPAERAAVEAAFAELAAAPREVAIEGLGSVRVDQAGALVRRVLLVDAAQGEDPFVLRRAGPDDFQVSHVGFGPDHGTATVYVSRAFVAKAGAKALAALLANDAVELAARQLARSRGLAWDEALSRRVQDLALAEAERIVPNALSWARAVAAGLADDFADLGLGAGRVRPEYLSAVAPRQQVLLNRLAALRAKGFAAEELSARLLELQALLDAALGPVAGKERDEAFTALKELRRQDYPLYSRLTAAVDLGPYLDGIGPRLRLPSEPHSQVQGLALRAHLALKASRVPQALRHFPGDAKSLERVWRSWDHADGSQTIPPLDKLPQVRTTLAGALEKVRAQALSEAVMAEKDDKMVATLVRRHPLIEVWRDAEARLRRQIEGERVRLRGLPPIRGKSPAMQALRDKKGRVRERIQSLRELARSVDAKEAVLLERGPALAELSRALREWFPGMKGLSVAGDFLWDKAGISLDMLMVVPGDDSPRKLRPEVLRKVAGLTGEAALEVSGYVVGEGWLKGAYADGDRNALVGRFALLGLTLWGPNLSNFYRKLPERELWAAAESLMFEAAEQVELGLDARSRLTLALSLATALGLRLHGADFPTRYPEWISLLEGETRLSRARRQTLERALKRQFEGVRSLLSSLREDGRYQDVERRLRSLFDRMHRRDQPGQIGGVLLESAAARAGVDGRRGVHELSPAEALEWTRALSAGGAPVPRVQEQLSEALDRLRGRAHYWEWLPETLTEGQFSRVGATSFGRPVEVRVSVREHADRPDLLGLLAEAPPADGAAVDRYEIFLNAAVFQMDPRAQQVVLGSLARQLGLALEGRPLDEAREIAAAELLEPRVDDFRKDGDVLLEAVRDYRAGVRVELLAEAPDRAWTARDWRRGARQDEAQRLAQAVAQYLKAPQRRQSGPLLLAYTSAGVRPIVERMAEVFAGNGIAAAIVEGETSSGFVHHAVREGAYRMGFLVSPQTVQPFGHYKGYLPDDELSEIVSAEHGVRRVRRLELSAARLQGLVSVREDVGRDYLASLKERFDARAIAASGLGLVVDSAQAEPAALLKALGVPARAVSVGGSVESLRRSMPDSGLSLGVSFGADGTSLSLLDAGGAAVKPSDLSLLFTWYLVRYRGHRGKIYRAFTQTRLLDRLASRQGLDVEEVDPSVWGIAEADSIVLSPWTPYNDLLAQALLAAEIVAKTGKSLEQNLADIRAELGAALVYEKDRVVLPAAESEKVAAKLSEEGLAAAVAKVLGVESGAVSARKSLKGIQVTLPDGAWFYLRWTPEALELYAESAEAARTLKLLKAGRGYLASVARELGPSRALKKSLLGLTLGGAAVVFLVGLPLLNPAWALNMPVIGVLYRLVGRLVELGFGMLLWLVPNILRGVMPSWNHPLVMSASVLLLLELFWFFGLRALAYMVSVLRRRQPGALAPEIQRLPDLPKAPAPEANDFAMVAPLKDGRLAAMKPAFSRLWEWLQPFLFVYQAESLIRNKSYDDRNVFVRGAINARAWLFFKSFLLEPRIVFATWWRLLSETYPGAARLLAATVSPVVRAWNGLRRRGLSWTPPMGLPTHVSPPVGVPLPAGLRERYRTQFAFVKKVSDGDTVQLFDEGLLASRWVRYKGMDASDNKKGDLYKRAKELNVKMTRGKKVLLVIPQVPQNDHLADEYDDHGRLLAYVFVQDQTGQWVNMTRLMLNEGLATIDKGAPDLAVPASLDVLEPAKLKKSVLEAPAPAEAPARSFPDEAALDDLEARRLLAALGADVSPQARLRLGRVFAGDKGERLAERLGAGLLAAERAELFVSGAGVSIGPGLSVRPGARLHVEAAAGAEGRRNGRVKIGSGVTVEGRVSVFVPADSSLHILAGARLIGDRQFSVPPGHAMSLRTLPDGSLSAQTEYRPPDTVFRRLWTAFRRVAPLSSLREWVEANKLKPAELAAWWRAGPRRYETVSFPRSLSDAKLIARERAQHLEGRHPQLVAEAVAARKAKLLKSATEIPRRFLLRQERQGWVLKQGLLAGLDRHYKVRYDLLKDELLKELQSMESRLARALVRRDFDRREVQWFVRFLREGPDAAAAREELPSDGLPAEAREEIAERVERVVKAENRRFARALAELPERLRQELEAHLKRRAELSALAEKRAADVGEHLKRAQERLADLAGLLLLGPRRLPDATSVILGGSYLFEAVPTSFELLVLRPGDEGPRLQDASVLKGVALPHVRELKVVSVGEEWLRRHPSDGLRNRLLTRFFVTGTTLWGRDVAALKAENLGGRIPHSNLIALAQEFLDGEPGEGELAVAHLALLGAVPGLVERLDAAAPLAQRLKVARRQLTRAANWLKSEELREIIGRGMSEVAAHPYADSGLGGVFVGDARGTEQGGQSLYKMSSKEGREWIDRLAAGAPAVEGAQARVDRLLERLKARGGAWRSWHPERLEEGQFRVIGRDSRGRLVEARVRTAYLGDAPGTLAVIAESEVGRKISDVDRYEILLNGVLFELDDAAQELVLDSVVRQLGLALAGRSLREARDTASSELGFADPAGAAARLLTSSLEEHARGLRAQALAAAERLPWHSSEWRGTLGQDGALRLGQGLARHLAARAPPERPGALLGWAGSEQKDAAHLLAQVLAGNGIRVRLMEAAAGPEAVAAGLASGGPALGVWVGAQTTRVIGQDGQGLAIGDANSVGWEALRAQSARTLPLGAAREAGLLEMVPVPLLPALAANASPGSAEDAALPRSVNRWASSVPRAFLKHAILMAVVGSILVGTVFFPSFVGSLPVVSVLFGMIRSMMMFKSFIAADHAWIVGLLLVGAVLAVRYLRMGRVMHAMEKGEFAGKFVGLAADLEGLPRLHRPATRSKHWSPVDALADGRIGIREESFARLPHWQQVLVYTHATARLRFMQHPFVRFFTYTAMRLIVGRFKIARVTFFVATEPIVLWLEAAMLWRMLQNWLLGRRAPPLYRITPEPSQGLPLLPEEVERQFGSEWVTVTAVLDDNKVQIEDGRVVRVIGAGATGKGVPLENDAARALLLGREALLLASASQEEGTRHLAGHLYVASSAKDAAAASASSPGPGPLPQTSRVLIRATHLLAARDAGHGARLPATAAVDAERLPLVLGLEEVAPEAEAKAKLSGWEKIYAAAALGVLAGLGLLAFFVFCAAGLSPLAHLIGGWGLGLLVLPALYGFYKLLRGKRGFVLNHKLVSLALIATLIWGALQPAYGPGWRAGPVAHKAGEAAEWVMDGLRLLPRPGHLGYDAPGVPAPAWRAPLPEGHPLLQQARAAVGGAYAADSAAVRLPAQLAAKYTAQWAVVAKAIDGDTEVLSNGTMVRSLAINTPETFHPGFDAKEKAQPGGEAAHKRNEELIGGKRVLLLVPKDHGRDSYRRLLAYVYAPDPAGSGKLINVNVQLLEEGHGNSRYGLPDPLLRGPYRTLDPKALAALAAPRAQAPAPEKVLALDANETRSFVQQRATLKRWVDAETAELSDGRLIKLREVQVLAGKSVEALKLVTRCAPPGAEVFLLHAKAYETPSEPWQKDPEGRLLDYLFFDAGNGEYKNLNVLLHENGLSGTKAGRPDAAVPASARLQKTAVNYEALAWEAAAAPLRALELKSADLKAAYHERVRALAPEESRPFQAAASLLALYAERGAVAPAEHERLLAALLSSRDAAGIDSWITGRLAPAVEAQLARQGVKVSGDWRAALTRALFGKLGAVPDVLYVPAERRQAALDAFLKSQGLAGGPPAVYAEGLVYGEAALVLPEGLRSMLPANAISAGQGAFWASLELAQLHRALLYENSKMSPLLMALAYEYPQSRYLMFPEARRYVAATAALGREALGVPELRGAVFQRLDGLVSTERARRVRQAFEQGLGSAALRELTPGELFTLGRSLADDPALSRVLLKSLMELRSISGKLQIRGTSMGEFQKELDALLAVPGGPSAAAQPLPSFDSLQGDVAALQRRIFAEILIQTVVAMDKENLPPRLLPLLLPRAVEAVQRAGYRASSPADWQTPLKAVKRLTPGQVRAWTQELLASGELSVGDALQIGLLDRDVDALLGLPLGSVSSQSYADTRVVGSLGFPADLTDELKTYKRGTFRVASDETAVYGTWKKGDLIKIMAGSKQNRQSLFNTRVISVEKKKLGDLTLDELRAEFPVYRFWDFTQDEEELRKQLVAELLSALRRFDPEVSLDTEGYFVTFQSYPEVLHKNR